MANEKFKVKFGLAVGDTAATIDGTTGDIVTAGDVAVNGGDLTTTQTTANLFNTTATTVNIGNAATTEVNLGNTGTGQVQIKSPVIIGANTTQTVFNTVATTVNAFGAATTISIGANTGTTTINNSLVADDISVTTVDTTNIEVTNIKAKDGTAAIIIADSTGVVTVSTQLQVDNINISTNTISSTDTNGNITLAPNGTGDAAFTFNNGGNLTNTRNYVFGAIRNATTDSIGDIWALNATGPVQPFRGISIDNSSDTTKLPGLVLRNYNNTSTNRARIIFERARGTAASPTAVQSGDFLGEVAVGGANGAGTWVNDTVSVSPAFFGFTAAENWSSNTNLGTNFALSLAPTATTITTGANLVVCMAIRPDTSVLKGDQFAISRAKTTAFTATGCSTSGTTLTIGTVTSGTVAVGQVVQTSTTSFLNSTYIVANISGSGSGSTWTVSSTPGTQSSLTVTGQTGFIGAPAAATTVDALADLRLLSNTIKSSGGTTQITTSSAGATLALAGDTITLESSAGTDYAVLNSTSATFAQPVGFPVKTVAQWGAITGVAGQQVCVSNSSTSPTQTEDGMMAYWGTTATAGWKYIHDNRAI